MIARESQFLLLALPPLALLAVLAALGVAYARVIQVIIGVGIASLGFWGGLAGHRAGLTVLRLALSRDVAECDLQRIRLPVIEAVDLPLMTACWRVLQRVSRRTGRGSDRVPAGGLMSRVPICLHVTG